jgi:Papain family cysteine protease
MGESAMINHVMNYGPLVVYLDASTLGYYTGGVFDACPANPAINHGVNIVGVNLNERYWIIRNTWGTQWGEQGYARLALVSTYVRTNIHMYIRAYIRTNTSEKIFTLIFTSLLIYLLLVY